MMFAFRIAAFALLVFQAKAACPDSTWYNYNMICYKAFTDNQEWGTALSKCQAYGAVLASIHDISQNSFIEMVMSLGGSSTAWVGLNDLAVEGVYKWADQSKCKFGRQIQCVIEIETLIAFQIIWTNKLKLKEYYELFSSSHLNRLLF